MEFNHYQVLGIPRHASLDQIKKAYKTLAKKYHPDVNTGSAFYEDHFKKINAAYAVLSDPVKRQQYDHRLYRLEHPAMFRQPQPAPNRRPPSPPRRTATPPPARLSLSWPSRPTLLFLGVLLLIFASGYTLYRVMNRIASNNHYESGLECEQQKDYAGAIYFYRQGLEMDRENYKIRERLARVLIDARPEFKESYQQAAALYASVLPHKKEHKDTVLYALAFCYLQLQEYDKSLLALEEIKPGFNDTVWLMKGECYVKNKKWENALDEIGHFLDRHPTSDLALEQAAYVHYKNIEYEKAKTCLDQAILLDPSNATHYYFRGLVFIGLADTLSACQDFSVSSSLNYDKADRALYHYCQRHTSP